jgi:branched-chain amino acid transport system ATP-binding protein
VSVEVDGLTAGYGSATIIRDVSFTVGAGETLAVLGRNGMGKTTIVRALLGLLPGSSGSVRICGNEVHGWSPRRIIRLGVGYGPQDNAIFGDLSVNENLRLANLNVADFQRRRDAVLRDFPALADRLSQKAGTLSGGEQKMLVLVRALIGRPSVLLLDEISEGLQPSLVETVREVLKRTRTERELTLVVVEQNIDLAMSIADHIAVVQVGTIRFARPVDAPRVRDEIVEAFSL